MKTDVGYKPGDFVVYKVTKQSSHPTPRASKVYPSPHGDNYTYCVEKYWVVDHMIDDSQIVVRTRRGKERTIDLDDPCLRHANWWERVLSSHRFPLPPEKATKIDQPILKAR
ncbi:hypothetical protein [Lacunimicrobium album]